MRIGFDAKRLYTNFTGLGNYSRSLVSGLNSFFPEETYVLYTPSVKKHQATEAFASHPSIITRTPQNSFNPLWRSFSMVNQLKKDKIDLYHGLSHELPFSIQSSGIKTVVSIHDLIFKVYPKTYSAVDRWIYDWKFKSSCENSDRIIAISENTKRDIVNYYEIDPAKIKVIYQACNPLFYALPKNADRAQIFNSYGIPEEFILYVGSVIPRKNLLTIIESYRYLPAELQIPLVVIGNGGLYKKEIKKAIEANKLQHRVIWVKHLKDNEHLRMIYQQAQVLIYPSLYEGFGLPIAEALLCKTPVIAANGSSLTEAGGPASIYLTHPTDPEEMAAAIEKVLKDSVLRHRMKAEGYSYAIHSFDPARISKEIHSLYTSLL